MSYVTFVWSCRLGLISSGGSLVCAYCTAPALTAVCVCVCVCVCMTTADATQCVTVIDAQNATSHKVPHPPWTDCQSSSIPKREECQPVPRSDSPEKGGVGKMSSRASCPKRVAAVAIVLVAEQPNRALNIGAGCGVCCRLRYVLWRCVVYGRGAASEKVGWREIQPTVARYKCSFSSTDKCIKSGVGAERDCKFPPTNAGCAIFTSGSRAQLVLPR